MSTGAERGTRLVAASTHCVGSGFVRADIGFAVQVELHALQWRNARAGSSHQGQVWLGTIEIDSRTVHDIGHDKARAGLDQSQAHDATVFGTSIVILVPKEQRID
jgi:hypothetical protein